MPMLIAQGCTSDEIFLQSRTVCLLIFLLALAWFLPLDYRHLIPADEGRYAEIAREMWVSGDWVTIRYNDYKYFEKPPLQLWMTALAYEFFGVGEWQARLWSALTGFFTIIAVGFTGWRIFGARAGFLAATVLASAPWWVMSGHFNSLDMGLSAMMAFALCALLLAQRPEITQREQRHWMWICWVAMALAVLSKGVIGIALPGLVLFIYSIFARDWGLWGRLHIVSGLLIFLLIAAPWFVMVSIKNPEFPQFFFVHEHFERFITNQHEREGSVFYFLPLLVAGFLPWLPQLMNMPHQALQPASQNRFKPNLILLVWAVSIFVFFSTSHSKLPGYIVPIFPALALLAGTALANKPTFWRWQIVGAGVFFLVGFTVVLLVFLFEPSEKLKAYNAYSIWLLAAFAVGFLGVVAVWRLRQTGLMASITCYAATFYIFITLGSLGHETLGRATSGADIAAKVRPLLLPDTPLYSLVGLDHTLPFYLQHPVIMVQRQDELAFGIAQEPQKWVPTEQDFITRWRSDKQAFAIMTPQIYKKLLAQKLPMEKIAENERRVIVRQ